MPENRRRSTRDPTDETPPERRTEGTVRRRIIAFVVDAAAVVGPVAFGANRFDRSLAWRVPMAALVAGVVGLPYHVFLEGRYGRTLGKRLVGIAVVGEDGAPPTYTAATVRTLLRVVDGLPGTYLVGLATIALTERRQRIGDLLANTVVVRTDGTRGRREDEGQ